MIWAWVLFGLGCLRLLVMINLYRPVTRPGLLNLVSFFTGWLTGELMHYLLAWEFVISLVLAQLGALDHTIGQAGMVLTVLAWFGFHLHMLSAKQLASSAELALQKAYGKGYQEEILPSLREQFVSKVPWSALWSPFSMAHPDVECIADIPYYEKNGLRLRLDLYHPKAKESPEVAPLRPILLQVHGGGWVIGSKDHQGLPLMNHMAARGWLCVAINYRLSPRAAFPDHLIDVKRAIAWIRQHAQEYGGDPTLLVITGGSAGAHLAALSALTPNQPEYQPEFPEIDTSVTACVPFYGPYDLTPTGKLMRHFASRFFLEKLVFQTSHQQHPERFVQASPQYQIGADAPPFFVLHGDADSLASIEDARRFVSTLREISQQPVGFAELPKTQHAFDVFHSQRCLLAVYAVARYLALIQSQHQATQSAETPGGTP